MASIVPFILLFIHFFIHPSTASALLVAFFVRVLQLRVLSYYQLQLISIHYKHRNVTWRSGPLEYNSRMLGAQVEYESRCTTLRAFDGYIPRAPLNKRQVASNLMIWVLHHWHASLKTCSTSLENICESTGVINLYCFVTDAWRLSWNHMLVSMESTTRLFEMAAKRNANPNINCIRRKIW